MSGGSFKPEKFTVEGRGFSTMIEVCEGRIINKPEHIEQYQHKNWDWAQEQFKKFQWKVGPYFDGDAFLLEC